MRITSMSAAVAVWSAPPFDGLRMSENFKATLIAAFKPVMRPLVRILVRNGVSFGEFAELVKMVFVESAQDALAPRKKGNAHRRT